MVKESYHLTSYMLIPASDYFPDGAAHQFRYVGQSVATSNGPSAPGDEQEIMSNTVNFILVNAQTPDQIPAALVKDREFLEKCQKDVPPGNLEQADYFAKQLGFVQSLQEMVAQPVYQKKPHHDLLAIAATNMRRPVAENQVVYVSGISAMTKG